jgi:hypothetical protein
MGLGRHFAVQCEICTLSYQLSAVSRAPSAVPSTEPLGKLGAPGYRAEGTIAATELRADR